MFQIPCNVKKRVVQGDRKTGGDLGLCEKWGITAPESRGFLLGVMKCSKVQVISTQLSEYSETSLNCMP